MPRPREHKTVQARILAYAEEIGWTFVPRAEAERRRGFDHAASTPEERARSASPYFGDVLYEQICGFNPDYRGEDGALIEEWQRLRADIAGNRDFLTVLRNHGKFFSAAEDRELDLTVIDYDDLGRSPKRWRNIYEVTEEFYVHMQERDEG
jgi:type I restriction enzyme, R subunit